METVKHGDLVTFECINRDNFEEMVPGGPEMQRICKDPVNGKGTVAAPSPWPKCTQLDCKCLGKAGGLTQQQARY